MNYNVKVWPLRFLQSFFPQLSIGLTLYQTILDACQGSRKRPSESVADAVWSTKACNVCLLLILPAQLALWWSLFENASASVRSGDIFSGFIYLISGSNSTVGYIQGINGCMQARKSYYTLLLTLGDC